MKVLLVSQSTRARAWIRTALGPSWKAVEAADGREALRVARAESPKLVIADETTVPYGAFGLARELKILPEPPAVIVLLERAHDAWLARWSGADAWLVQPVDPFSLAAAAQEALVDASQAHGEAEPSMEPVRAIAGTGLPPTGAKRET